MPVARALDAQDETRQPSSVLVCCGTRDAAFRGVMNRAPLSSTRGRTAWALIAPAMLAAPLLSTTLLGCKDRTYSIALSASAVPTAPMPPPLEKPPILPGSFDVPALVTAVRPVVVNITVEQIVRPSELGFELPFQHFGLPSNRRDDGGEPMLRRQGQGSGFIVDNLGHVVTNAHVVEGADAVRVRLADEREFKAIVKGRDPQLDIAVVELQNASDLPVASLGSSEALRGPL